jgi:hypothetical protein
MLKLKNKQETLLTLHLLLTTFVLSSLSVGVMAQILN